MPQVELVKIKDLTLLERNPRKIQKDQLQKLSQSLKDDPDFLKLRPCLVNKKDGKLIVYAGNQRVQAAKRLKLKEIPCIIEEDLDETILKSRIVKDNKHYGEFDYDILYCDFDIDMLQMAGFSLEELTGDFSNLNMDPEDKIDKEKKITKCPNCQHEF